MNRGYRVFPIPDDVIQQQRQHVLLSGIYAIRAGCFFEAHGHAAKRENISEHIVIYCQEGQGWLRMAGREHAIYPGNVLFVMPGSSHAYGADPKDAWSIYWSHFSGDHVSAFLNLAQITLAQPVVRKAKSVNILSHMTELVATLQAGYSLHHLLRAAAILRHLLSELALLNAYSTAPNSKGLDVEKLIRFMIEHLADSCSLQNLADEAHLSSSHLAHEFRSKTGYAPIDYYIRLKMQKACELLEATDLTIEEISRKLGYREPFYFSRLFKKVVGIPPSRYRARREERPLEL